MLAETDLVCVLELFGHDGSQLIWPDLPEPKCRLGFAVNEMVMVAYRLDCDLIPVIPEWPSRPDKNSAEFLVKVDPVWVEEMYSTYDGILIGRSCSKNEHAVCWDHDRNLILDPNGTSYPRSMFLTEQFWARVDR